MMILEAVPLEFVGLISHPGRKTDQWYSSIPQLGTSSTPRNIDETSLRTFPSK